MRYLFLILAFFTFMACSTVEESALHGRWEGDALKIQLNPDKTAIFFNGMAEVKCTYHKFGNTIELINENNKVIFNMRIQELKEDKLYINLHSMGADNVKELKRVK